MGAATTRRLPAAIRAIAAAGRRVSPALCALAGSASLPPRRTPRWSRQLPSSLGRPTAGHATAPASAVGDVGAVRARAWTSTTTQPTAVSAESRARAGPIAPNRVSPRHVRAETHATRAAVAVATSAARLTRSAALPGTREDRLCRGTLVTASRPAPANRPARPVVLLVSEVVQRRAAECSGGSWCARYSQSDKHSARVRAGLQISVRTTSSTWPWMNASSYSARNFQ